MSECFFFFQKKKAIGASGGDEECCSAATFFVTERFFVRLPNALQKRKLFVFLGHDGEEERGARGGEGGGDGRAGGARLGVLDRALLLCCLGWVGLLMCLVF